MEGPKEAQAGDSHPCGRCDRIKGSPAGRRARRLHQKLHRQRPKRMRRSTMRKCERAITARVRQVHHCPSPQQASSRATQPGWGKSRVVLDSAIRRRRRRRRSATQGMRKHKRAQGNRGAVRAGSGPSWPFVSPCLLLLRIPAARQLTSTPAWQRTHVVVGSRSLFQTMSASSRSIISNNNRHAPAQRGNKFHRQWMR